MTKSNRINDSIRGFVHTFAAMKFSQLLFFIASVFIVFLASCEKEISIPLSSNEGKLVVEGYITNDEQPFVLLTKSIGFFDKIDFTNIEFVDNAEVWVSDITANKKTKLQPISSPPFTVYTLNNLDPTYLDFEKGIPGHTYLLEINYNNVFYTAVSKMPHSPGFDSLFFEPNPDFNDTLYTLRAYYSDPDTIGNSFKYFTKRSGNGFNDTEFIEPFSSRFDDNFINGKKNLPVDLFIGFDQNDSVDNAFSEGRSFSKRGDTITVKLQAMDKAVYDFWKTLDFAEGSIGNPFASPTQVQSNISNDALGAWSAYNNTYHTVINKP